MDVGVTVDGADAFMLSGQIARVSFQGGLARFADDIARGFDARAQLAAMDREGIDVTVLYPSRGLFVHSISDLDPAFSEAIARAYNDWLADFCRDGDPRRMYGAAMLPIHDVAASIREARRAVRDLGFKAVFLRPNPPRRGVYWHHPRFDPLWAEVQDLDVPVGFHEGVASRMPTAGDDRFAGDLFCLQHACSHSMEQMLALEAMTLGGVLERFPRLRVAFLEGNGSWLPFWLWRLDEHWENPGRYENPALKLRAQRALPAPGLRVAGVRRNAGPAGDRRVGRRGLHLLHGLSPLRHQVPRGDGALPEASDRRGEQAPHPLGQLRAAIPDRPAATAREEQVREARRQPLKAGVGRRRKHRHLHA
jgi:predicted TIM-barrel fold metal-dependent hydrolase